MKDALAIIIINSSAGFSGDEEDGGEREKEIGSQSDESADLLKAF